MNFWQYREKNMKLTGDNNDVSDVTPFTMLLFFFFSQPMNGAAGHRNMMFSTASQLTPAFLK